jgi:predicted amidohydrolase YtcJ
MSRRHLLAMVVAVVHGSCGSATPPPADLVVVNARIYTVDAANRVVDALAVTGDRIAAVGRSRDILPRRGEATHVIDARGATVVPGLHDAHGHFVGLGESLQIVDLRGTRSYDEVVARVRERVAAAAAGEWVLGRGWDQNDWADSEWPTHHALSAISPDNPVYLTRVDGHAGLANARALAIADVTGATADPQGGRIIRADDGSPTGVLVDRAEDLVASRIPKATAEQVAAQALLADTEARRLGLTMVHDAGTPLPVVDLYRGLIDSGRLKTRLYVMLSGSLDELTPAFARGPIVDDARRLAVRAVKISADGALGSRGAALLEPYSDEPGTSGLLVTPPDEVYARTLAASRAGFQTAVHAIGDRANRLVLDVFERVQREVPGARGLRMRVEHAQILDPREIPRFARLDVIASMQPTHATSDMPWVPARIGEARMREGAYVWRRLRTAGARIAAGSDFPVEEANPFFGFYAAVTRQDRSGQPAGGWIPGERLTRQEALRAFTIDAAYAAHAEAYLGSIEPGKLADFVMLSHDIMQVPPDDILDTTVQMTVVGGEIVHGAFR